ncbi:Protein C26F1.3 [Aphelenchoides avenae]|nr:Protein C26F1.3 [Aphelenchus avenae]
MSLQLVKRSLELDDDDDGITRGPKRKPSGRRQKRTLVEEEREMLKNAGGRFHFDLETGELVKPKKAAVRKAVNSVEDVVSDRDARMGHSLVEQYRAHKPLDVARRNLKYMKFVEKNRIGAEKLKEILAPEARAVKERRKRIAQRNDVKAAFYLDRPKQTKKEVSLFSEEDFAKVGQRKFAASIKRIK